jgi:biopolymer transport protein ExbD
VRRRRLRKEAAHLEITAFINLIVVLVPFLLSTAVFTRLAVMDMNLPAPSTALAQLSADSLQLEVVIRHDALEIGDRVGGLIQRIPRQSAGHDFKALGAAMLQIKARFPQAQEAALLSEEQTPYNDVVQTMEAVRSSVSAQGAKVVRSELFPRISLGDAPVRAALAAKAAS